MDSILKNVKPANVYADIVSKVATMPVILEHIGFGC